MGSKIPKTTGIFDDVDHHQSRGVTYWAERIGPLVDHISQFSCCVAFGAIQKNHMLFQEVAILTKKYTMPISDAKRFCDLESEFFRFL